MVFALAYLVLIITGYYPFLMIFPDFFEKISAQNKPVTVIKTRLKITSVVTRICIKNLRKDCLPANGNIKKLGEKQD
jgi:hypothetical protein